MGNDLISRSALKSFYCKCCNVLHADEPCEPRECNVMGWVDELPAVDAVEVVRCRDCIYYETGKDYLPYCNHADGGIDDYPREDDFCSYGERRTSDVAD